MKKIEELHDFMNLGETELLKRANLREEKIVKLSQSLSKDVSNWDEAIIQLTEAVEIVIETRANNPRMNTSFTNKDFTETATIKLARNITEQFGNSDQALTKFRLAIKILTDISQIARRGGNLSSFIDEVLRRIADLSDAGKFDEASAEADRAFAQWEEDEAERVESAKQQGLKLPEAELQQGALRLRRDPDAITDLSDAGKFDEASAEADRAFAQWVEDEAQRAESAKQQGLKILDTRLQQSALRRDPDAIAQTNLERFIIEAPGDRHAQFQNLRSAREEYLAQGLKSGEFLDLETSVALAKLGSGLITRI